MADNGVGGRGVRVKKRRLLRVRVGSYGGGHVVVVNYRGLVVDFSYSSD